MAPNGFYARVKPKGTWIRRFLCRRTGKTVSLLPDCFAAHVKGTLEEIEASVQAADRAPSQAAAASEARPECGLAGALRWLRRRQVWVASVLGTVKSLLPERFAGGAPTLAGFEAELGAGMVLRSLREVAGAHLGSMVAPVGLGGWRGVGSGVKKRQGGGEKHKTGLSPPGGQR